MLADLSLMLSERLGFEPWIWTVVLRMGIVAGVFLPAIGVLAMISIWGERKVAGHIQGRMGPKHVGPFGLFQSLADGVKLIAKEDLVPAGSDQFLFRFAPYIAFAPVFAAFLVIPFGPQFVFETGLKVGVLYLLAMLGLEVMGVIFSGWASNSKWAIYGAMREACQIVSYEIPLGVAILCGVLVAGTLDLMELSFLQGAGIQTWFVVHNPFVFLAFFIYFVASLASAKRAPFDLPEGESELVAGFHTEYSGLRWSFFFFAEYAGMFIIGCIQAVLFLGAWNSPLGAWDPVYMILGYDPVAVGEGVLSGSISLSGSWNTVADYMGLSHGAAGLVVLNVYCMTWLLIKATLVILLHMWIRWTLPRIRIDQVLHGCVKGLLPVSLAMLCGAAIWIALLPETAPRSSATTANIAHLTGDIGVIQTITQWVLTLVLVVLLAFYGLIAFGALITRKRAPRKGMFDDVMPVGSEIAFTRGPEYQTEEERSLAQD